MPYGGCRLKAFLPHKPAIPASDLDKRTSQPARAKSRYHGKHHEVSYGASSFTTGVIGPFISTTLLSVICMAMKS